MHAMAWATTFVSYCAAATRAFIVDLVWPAAARDLGHDLDVVGALDDLPATNRRAWPGRE